MYPFVNDYDREEVWSQIIQLIGRPPFDVPPPLNPQFIASEDADSYIRHKVRYGNESDDVVWAYLLIPKQANERCSAVICLPGSYMTRNCGKEIVVGLAPSDYRDDPEAYGHDLVTRGFITLCPDYPCSGQRTSPGLKPHDTTQFDQRFPTWTRTGMSAWDVTRAVDFLLTLPKIDPNRIGCTGFSQGGMMSLWGTALDPRIACVATVCGWSTFHGRNIKPLLTPCKYPRLQQCLNENGSILDIKKYLAMMIAPRPFLSVSGREDHHFQNHTEQIELEKEINDHYRSTGNKDNFRAIRLPRGHRYSPEVSQLVLKWFEQWLKNPATPLEH